MHLRRATGEVKRRQQGSGPRGFSSEMTRVADADVVLTTEGCIPSTAMRGAREPPESLARGTLSEGFPTNVGDLHVSARGAVPCGRGRPKAAGTGVEES